MPFPPTKKLPRMLTVSIFFVLFLVLGCDSEQDAASDTTDSESIENRAVEQQDKILIFHKTDGFRHASIEKGLQVLKELGSVNNFKVEQTEDALDFNAITLSQFQTVIFLNTTGDILNFNQQTAFESYIEGGGSFMGVHSATDTEYNWPWYGKLIGAYFDSHPDVQEADLNIIDQSHPSTIHLSKETWTRTDEWYNFRDINSNINVLLTLDETSYTGGTNGANHPAAWYHEFEGGRSFYTAGGHSDSSYDEPDFQKHLLGGIFYCLGRE